ESAIAHVEEQNDGHKDKGHTHGDFYVFSQSALEQGVIDEHRHESQDNHDQTTRGEFLGVKGHLFHVVDDKQHQKPCNPGPGSTPSEPVESSGHQLGYHGLSCGSIEFSSKRSIDEIEKVKVAYHQVSGQEMHPPKNRLNSR